MKSFSASNRDSTRKNVVPTKAVKLVEPNEDCIVTFEISIDKLSLDMYIETMTNLSKIIGAKSTVLANTVTIECPSPEIAEILRQTWS